MSTTNAEIPGSEAQQQKQDIEKANSAKNESGTSEVKEKRDIQYPPFKKVLVVYLCVCLAVFLTALDRTIIGVAVPSISNQFGSFDEISWYESAYLLTFAALQLPLGKVYTYLPAKWTYIAIVVIFELGSLVCAAAPNSTAFIIGRAIAGIGSAGTTTGAQVIFVDLIPVEKRPAYQGGLGAVFGLASIAGPLLGGVFTSKLTWRWCFWINLPIGGVALAGLLLILPNNPAPREHVDEPLLRKIRRFDPIGTSLLLPGLVMLLLALQWGGTQYPWNSAVIIALLVAGLALIACFGVSQVFIGEDGTVPPRIIRQRSIAASAVESLGFGSTLLILTFYLPIWFQAIKGLSAVQAGVRLLPYFLSTVTLVIGSGLVVAKTGVYVPWMIAGNGIAIIGCGLLTTFSQSTSNGEWIGYELLVGFGMGMALAQPQNAVLATMGREDIPIASTLVGFAQFVGSTIFISVCQGILSNTLTSKLSKAIPGLDVSSLLSSGGATSIEKSVPRDKLPIYKEAYNSAIVNVFYVALAMSSLAFVASFFIEFRNVKDGPTAEKGKDQTGNRSDA